MRNIDLMHMKSLD